MKYLAIFLCILVVVMAGLGIYAYANVKLQIGLLTLEAVAASERVGDFVALQERVAQHSLTGTAFVEEIPGDSSAYSFFTYTFRFKNTGLIDAEMVEIQPVPENGDMLCYASMDSAQANSNTVVSARSERDVWLVLLTSAQNQQNHQVTRTFRITYYVWGIPMTLTATYQ